jgi:heme/copper-type cytochrome/quinol oxidase subunit 2
VVTVSIIFKIILYLTMGYGAYVSWTAFRSNKNKAWLLICIFCLSIFFALAVRTGIKAIFHERYEKNAKTYIVDKDGKKIETKKLTINFPIFQILLVIGLSYLAKDEIKTKVQSK